jgi:Ca2+-binding RTX toxin-like protein
MTQPTAYEQYLLELINAERAKVGAQPLAFDGDLNEAAEGHSQWMIATDTFSHTGAGGSNAGTRMSNAGYVFTGSWAWGENIAYATTRSPAGLQDEVLLLHTNLMNSSGHRANILNANYREVGLGFEVGDYLGRETAFITENFAKSGSSVFLTGVAFDDKDGDIFYDPGEGLSGLTVRAVSSTGAAYTTTTMTAGGYDLVLPAGSYSVTFSGGGFTPVTKQVTVGSSNVKLDLVDPVAGNGEPPPPPPPDPGAIVGTANGESLYGTSGADLIQALGGADRLYGRSGNDRLEGGTGNDYLYGEAGNDVLLGGDGDDRLTGGSGIDTLTGNAGRDTFVFRGTSDTPPSGPDVVTDFVHGVDRFDFSGIDARLQSTGNQAFAYAGQNAGAVANSITWYESGGNTIIQGDIGGNTTVDFMVVVHGTNLQLTASDFIL